MKARFLPHLALPLVLLATLPAFRPAGMPTKAVAADGREVRQVAAFSKLTLATSAEVILVQGSTQKVEVSGSAEDLKELTTTVENGRLTVGTVQKNWNNWRGFKGSVKVYVTMPSIEALAVSGSGQLHADQMLRGGSVQVAVSGSGQLRAPLTAESIEANVSGSGSLKLSGSTTSLNAGISGSGRIEAGELAAKTCEARLSGSGNCRVNVAQTLDARISGSGNVYYAGSPRVTSHVAGSGRVSKS
ncbi:head GIN domain-containing protein [Hymenobacter sp. CRA2]|uniref:head GIN domain-containing protein n=1 Tax=Hymenobacter sp. CRA2 TaxID=1955620 RepID=UPI00111689A9|nr:head GIN domain-containing protein [Hymenobacter sp. CRA2]